MIPLLLAATPLPVQAAVPTQPATTLNVPLAEYFGQQAPMQTFDPVLRAAALASTMPRQWSGTYQPFAVGSPVTVQLSVASATALGQMIDVRGDITVGSSTVPFQGNYNAKSDQVELLVLGGVASAGLEDGGLFMGLQGFDLAAVLAGWMAPRLTNPGGQLVLNPVAGSAAPAVRGLW